tara:strand:+ start:3983 stop:4384 length:402 start_codon:yes stop_codon:yes gene_type:complete
MMPRKGKGQKVSVASGQTYGKRAVQEEAQRAVPMARSEDLAPRPSVRPGGFGGVTRPTERPRQPLTAGAPVGPGGGPEMLVGPQRVPDEEVSERLVSYLPILETKAAQPDSTANFRMFVRRVRALVSRAPAGR